MILLYLTRHGHVHHMASVPRDFDFDWWWALLWYYGHIEDDMGLEWEYVPNYVEDDPDKLIGNEEYKREYFKKNWS